MSIIFDKVNSIAEALNFHMQRQNLIASNVANVDTPGFEPREVLRPDNGHGEVRFNLAMRSTNPKHYAASTQDPSVDYKVIHETNEIPGNDLNYVSLEHEMARLNANAIRFEAVGKLVTKNLVLLGYAANDAR